MIQSADLITGVNIAIVAFEGSDESQAYWAEIAEEPPIYSFWELRDLPILPYEHVVFPKGQTSMWLLLPKIVIDADASPHTVSIGAQDGQERPPNPWVTQSIAGFRQGRLSLYYVRRDIIVTPRYELVPAKSMNERLQEEKATSFLIEGSAGLAFWLLANQGRPPQLILVGDPDKAACAVVSLAQRAMHLPETVRWWRAAREFVQTHPSLAQRADETLTVTAIKDAIRRIAEHALGSSYDRTTLSESAPPPARRARR